MALVAAMDAYVLGENGRAAHETTGNALLDFFFRLTRDLPRDELRESVARLCETHEPKSDLLVLWASTRDVRGGKGERALGNGMLAELARHIPAVVSRVLPLVPEYGSWKDVNLMLTDGGLPPETEEALLQLYTEQLRRDFGDPKPSLAVKWAPREKSSGKALAKQLALRLFADHKAPRATYRQHISASAAQLPIAEHKMTAKLWSEIDPSSVPAVCLTKHRLAFQNMKSGKRQKSEPRSADSDRIACAVNFGEHARRCVADPSKNRMHGRAQSPHEMVQLYFATGTKEDALVEAQWIDLVHTLREEHDGKNLGRMIPLIDVSGSMAGTPMFAAIAIGLLLSELAHADFRHRFLTFETRPQWRTLPPKASLFDKVQSTKQAPWGGSTDLTQALELVLNVCTRAKLPREEVAGLELVILSDMQFDAAQYGRSGSREWATQYQELVQIFGKAGYPVPRLVFWNLRAATGVPVQEDTVGVRMLSGFSPSLLKNFLDPNASEEMQDAGEILRKVLSDERYEAVRRAAESTAEIS